MDRTKRRDTHSPQIEEKCRRDARTGTWQMPVVTLALVMLLTGCGPAVQTLPATDVGDGRLQVLATTSILGDVVGQIGGDAIALTVLLPVGTDPHSFQATPQDVAKVAKADVVFVSGLGLELFMDDLIANAGGATQVVTASEGIVQRAGSDDSAAHDDQPMADPHVWVDPNNVLVWVDNIFQALAALDPEHRDAYQANAERYRRELKNLDAWIRTQVTQIPPQDRKLVTDHLIFGYFADRYGFEQVGAIVPGYSSMASPSAQELAALEETINDLGVKAVFVGNTVNPDLATRVAEDTGVKLVFVYTGSLTEPGGDADNYLDFMRYNVSAIVDALR